MVFFGKYDGSFTKTGFHWVNPFYAKKKLSMRARNLDVAPIKVNDKGGNPIMVGLVLVWKLKDTYKAMFEIDSQTMASNVATGVTTVSSIMKAFENYGNNTMCSVPTTLALLDKDTDKKNICCCAFGNGLVSIASILDLSKTYISEIRYFNKPDYVLSRDEYINYWRKKIAGEQQSEN